VFEERIEFMRQPGLLGNLANMNYMGYFRENKKGSPLPNPFYEIIITLKEKPDKDFMKQKKKKEGRDEERENSAPISLMNLNATIFKKVLLGSI
jgi:hypothetical protein